MATYSERWRRSKGWRGRVYETDVEATMVAQLDRIIELLEQKVDG